MRSIPTRAWPLRRGERPPEWSGGRPSIDTPRTGPARGWSRPSAPLCQALLDRVEPGDERRTHRLGERSVVEGGDHALSLAQRPAEEIGELLPLLGVSLLGVGDDPGERRDRIYTLSGR